MENPILEIVENESEDLPIKMFLQHRMDKDYGFPLHWHSALEFYFVVKGGIEILCDGHKEWLYSGDTCFAGSYVIHRGIRFLNDTEFITLQIDFNMLDGASDDGKVFMAMEGALPSFFKKDKRLESWGREIYELSSRPSIEDRYMIKGILYQMIGYLLSFAKDSKSVTSKESYVNKEVMDPKYSVHSRPSLELVTKVLHYMERAFNQDVTLTLLSRRFGVSKQHLSRVFKQYTGMTIHEHLNRHRCNIALTMIENGSELTRAAYYVGYKDYNYFSRVFKGLYGLSPRNFLKER